MYDATSIRKEMESVSKRQSLDVQTLFAPLMVAKTILTTNTPQKEYDDWVKSLTALVKNTDQKGHQIIYRVLAILHFKYEHNMNLVNRYAPLTLILKIGLEKGAYYYYFEHPDMRKQVFADFGVSDIEAFSIIREKMDVLRSIMKKSLFDRDRILASKELTKYIDCMIVPNKKNNFFANNMMMDNSKDKSITNNVIDFNSLPGMDRDDVRKELAHNVVTVDENGEVENG